MYLVYFSEDKKKYSFDEYNAKSLHMSNCNCINSLILFLFFDTYIHRNSELRVDRNSRHLRNYNGKKYQEDLRKGFIQFTN